MALTQVQGGMLAGSTNTTTTIQSNGTTAITIDSTQNVGIGTSSPTFAAGGGLNVANSTFATMRARGGSSTGTDFAQGSDGKGYVYVRDNADLIVGTNNTERMRITSGGNLLINTSTNSFDRVQIYENNAAYNSLYLNSSSNTGTQYYISFSRQGTQAGYLTSNSSTTVQLNNSSDVRLKENITDANSAIPSIMSAKVRQFDWKENISPHQDFGFVAQELVDVIPEAVTVGIDNEDGTIKMPWGIDYSHIVPRLVKAIQELKAELDATKAEVAALKAAP